MRLLPFRNREEIAQEVYAQVRPHFALRRALLCLDCESCYESDGGSCPACGSMAAILMSKLDRPAHSGSDLGASPLETA